MSILFEATARARRNRHRNTHRLVSPVIVRPLVRARTDASRLRFNRSRCIFVHLSVFYPCFMDGFCVYVDGFVGAYCLCVFLYHEVRRGCWGEGWPVRSDGMGMGTGTGTRVGDEGGWDEGGWDEGGWDEGGWDEA